VKGNTLTSEMRTGERHKKKKKKKTKRKKKKKPKDRTQRGCNQGQRDKKGERKDPNGGGQGDFPDEQRKKKDELLAKTVTRLETHSQSQDRR